MKRKWLIGLILALLGGILLTICLDRPADLPAAIVLPPTPLVVKSGRVPDRWIPVKWTWLRRACLFVFGHPRKVGFRTQFIEVSESVATIIARNSLGPPQAESNGLAIWILDHATLRSPEGALKIWPVTSVETRDRLEARATTGTLTESYNADFFGRLAKGTVDLSTRLIVTSGTQTNFVAAVRAQLPYSRALFILDARQPESVTNRLEFLIMADEYDDKGNMVLRKAGR